MAGADPPARRRVSLWNDPSGVVAHLEIIGGGDAKRSQRGRVSETLSRRNGLGIRMRVGLLTGGGDCPGLNAVIRAVVQRVVNGGGSCVGILEGWRGPRPRHVARARHRRDRWDHRQGGDDPRSSRTNPFKNAATDIPALRPTFEALELDALVAIGGDDTLGVAHRLHKEFICRWWASPRRSTTT
jgi:hypothetical protein